MVKAESEDKDKEEEEKDEDDDDVEFIVYLMVELYTYSSSLKNFLLYVRSAASVNEAPDTLFIYLVFRKSFMMHVIWMSFSPKLANILKMHISC